MTRTYDNRTMTAKRYPNSAAPGYFLSRMADGILCAASCMGIVTAFFLLLAM